MKKLISFSVLCICLFFFVIACTDKNEIQLQIDETKKQIRIFDEQIYQLEQKRALLSAVTGNRPNGMGEKISRIGVDPEIQRLQSERQLLLLKLNSLYEKL